jgi:uncharacterized protein YfaS (alpha-2-macroglobulin family)
MKKTLRGSQARDLCAGLLIACACFGAAVGQPYTYIPADRNQAASAKGDAKILPASYLREYDPVTVFFGKDVVPGDAGPVEPPASLLSVTPAHPGEFIKIDARTIEFRPAAPWEPLRKYKIVAGKSARELVTLLPLPREVSPAPGSTDLEPVNRVEFAFSAKIDPQTLSRLVSFEVCALPGVDGKGCRTLKPSEYKVRESARAAREDDERYYRNDDDRREPARGAPEYLYRFTFSEPVGYGQKVKINLKLANKAEFKDALRVYSFETKPEFTMEKAGTYGQMYTLSAGGIAYDARQAVKLSSDKTLIVEFSAPLADPGLSVMKNMVSMTPAPSEFKYVIDNNRVIFSLGIEQEKLYRVALHPVALKDRAGRALTNRKPCSFFAYLPKVQPFAEWGRGFGIVERFGPQRFPIKTKGVSALDLRVYKIDPLHGAFSRFSRSQTPVLETSRPPGPGEEPERMDTASGRMSGWLNGSTVAKHIMMLGSPQYAAVIDLDKEGINKFQSVDLKPILASIGGKDKPGTYLVGFRLLDGSPYRYYARVDVTDLCLSVVESKNKVLFGVTSYSNGKAVPDASIRIDGSAGDKMVVLAQGKTGPNGFFSLEHTPEMKGKFGKAEVRRVVASKGDDVLVLDGNGPGAPQVFANNHWFSETSSLSDRYWLRWLTQESYSADRDKKLRGFVRAERPIYRPEDSVYIKGYVRETVHGAIRLPPKESPYIIRVYSPSRTYVDYPVKLNEYGSFDIKIAQKDPSTGEYGVSLMAKPENQNRSAIAITDFAVEAYRIPRFEVRLSGAERIPNDGPAEVRAAASYYAGGRVAGQDIAWKITSYPYDHRPRGFAGYVLSSDGRYGAVAEARRQSVLEENAKTDDNGSARVTLNPQAAAAGNPVKYIVEATVTDADRQTVSARHTVVALPPFILGMRANRHITNGSVISARIAAIGVDDSLVAGQKVTVELKRVSWTSYLADSDFSRGKPKYITDEAVELIEEREILTGGEPSKIEFKNQQPGVYVLELSSRDRLGRLQSVKIDLYLSGSGQQAWKKAEQNVFETVSDRNSYEPGQQAKILLKSPYKKALALAVVEKPDGDIAYKWIDVSDGQGTFTLDIKQEMAPKIPVSFLLMRPRASMPRRAPDGAQTDAGKPETVGNTTWLTVNPVANMLDVKLTHAPVTTPGAALDVTVSLRDIQGKPRSGEAALWLVDEAVLSLRKEKSLDPLEAFLEEVVSNIAIRDSRNLALGSLLTNKNPGGDGGGVDELDALGKITPRKNFKTVPYWNPSIKIDRNGNAVVKIQMPDDLTNFSVRAMAVSGPDRFGTAKNRVSVRLPVTVQPALPRFVRLGDKIRAGGIARVAEGQGGGGVWSISAKGLTVGNIPNKQIQLDTVKPMPLLADLQVETPPFTSGGIQQWDSVSVRMSVMRNADKAADAFEVKIPVLPDRQFISETQFAQIDKGENFAWKALPEAARANTTVSNILISDNRYLPKIISAMTSLVVYPYGCTEQVVSQSYPSLVYKSLWDKYGVNPPDSSVAAGVEKTLAFLKTAQHSDGLFGYWPGTPGYVYLTAYVVDFLTEVKNANRTLKQPFGFDQNMYASAIEALKRSLRSDYGRYVSGHSAYERTCALAALAKSGHIDIGYARELAAAARELDVQGAANVLKAIADKQDALGSEYAALEKQLWESAVFVERGGAEAFAGFQKNSSRVGERMHSNDAAALASFVSAVSSPQNKNYRRMPLLVDELVNMGSADGWGSTYANSKSLLALREFIDNGEPSSNNTFNFNDGDKQQQLTMNGALSKYWSNGKAGSVARAGQPQRPFWVKLSRRYMPQSLGSSAEPEQRGFVVKRELIKINKGAAPEKFAIDKGGNAVTFTTGDIVEEHVQVVNPEPRLFAAVSVPLAAGFEPLNPKLENAPSDARPTNRSTNEGDYSAFFDDRVVYFFERMEQGTYDFYFRTQAITEGEFTQPPAKAEMMYQMSVYGASAGSKVVVKGK